MEAKTRALKKGTSLETPKWELAYLEVAEKEARKFLTEEQYVHAVQQFEQLAYETDPTNSETQDITKIEDFYELRDKGGLLRKINLRVYFTLFEKKKQILVLAAYKKEDESKVAKRIIIRVRNRLRVARKQ